MRQIATMVAQNYNYNRLGQCVYTILKLLEYYYYLYLENNIILW